MSDNVERIMTYYNQARSKTVSPRFLTEKLCDAIDQQKNLELIIEDQKTQLKEAEKVIDFYAWSFSEECELHDEYDIKFVGSQSGRKAREYKAKYNKDKG